MDRRPEDDATSAAPSGLTIPEEPFGRTIRWAVPIVGISFFVAFSYLIGIIWIYSGDAPLVLLVIWAATLASLILRLPTSRSRRLLIYLALWAGFVLLIISS